jgi:hypothetical protein
VGRAEAILNFRTPETRLSFKVTFAQNHESAVLGYSAPRTLVHSESTKSGTQECGKRPLSIFMLLSCLPRHPITQGEWGEGCQKQLHEEHPPLLD